MRKLTIELKWSLLFVAALLLWMLGEKLAGLHSTHIDKQEFYSHFFALPAIALYVLALLDKRKNYYGGSMTYLQGLVCGLLITGFVTLLNPLTQMITSEWITPEYFPNAIRYAVSTGRMSQPQADAYYNLNNYILEGLIGAAVMGLITSAVVALFTRRSKQVAREGKVDVVYSREPRVSEP